MANKVWRVEFSHPRHDSWYLVRAISAAKAERFAIKAMKADAIDPRSYTIRSIILIGRLSN